MRIKRELQISATMTIGFAIVAVITLFVTSGQANRAVLRGNQAVWIVRTVFELNYLVNDYLLHPGERSMVQWQLQHNAVRSQLAKAMFISPQEQDLLRSLQEENKALRNTFTELLAPSLSSVAQEVLLAQILTMSRSMVGDASNLAKLAFEEQEKTRNSANMILFSVLVALTAVSIIVAFLLYRSIARSLTELQKGTEKIAAGYLDYQIDIKNHDELWQVARSFNTMVLRIKEQDHAKTDFISIASHQLRTPISALNWVIEELQFTSQNLNSKQQRYVKDLSAMSKRLIEIVEDLLDFSRLELKTSAIVEKHEIEIPDFIEEFTKEMEVYAVSNKHSIILNKGIGEPLIIEINKKAFYNVLQNILSNAIDYSPENTAVTINLEKTETRSAEGSGEASSFVKISISNKGPAIPKDEKPHIFERFYRGESARKIKQEGTGLGLFIVKKIIEEEGGKVGFESEEGKDTVFWFTIPLKVINKS